MFELSFSLFQAIHIVLGVISFVCFAIAFKLFLFELLAIATTLKNRNFLNDIFGWGFCVAGAYFLILARCFY